MPAVAQRRAVGTILALALLVLCAFAVLSGPASAKESLGRAPSLCGVKNSTTVAVSAKARVYERSRRGDSDEHVLVGCLLGSGRRLALETWFDCGCSRGDESRPQVWLRGTVVAINRFSCPPDPGLGPCSGRAHTVDLRTSRTLREAQSGDVVSDLVLGARGAFVLLRIGGAVVKSDAEGEGVLDPGPRVELGSLALAGSRVYWTRDGAPRSALLHP